MRYPHTHTPNYVTQFYSCMDPVKEHFQQGYGNMVDINMNIVYYGEKQ